MEFRLKPEKTKKLSFLLNRVYERDETYKTPKFSFLLGAGCSVASGLPTGRGVSDICKTIAFLNSHEEGYTVKKTAYSDWHKYFKAASSFARQYQPDFEEFVAATESNFRSQLSRQDVISRLPANITESFRVNNPEVSAEKLGDMMLEEFREKIFADRLYGNWFEEFDKDSKERQKLIEYIIEDVEPAGDYIFFSDLVKQDIIHNIFTTNFDDLLNEALISYYNEKARVYSHNELAKYISPGSKKPNIIKLHGDYLFEDLKNSASETTILEPMMRSKFVEVLNALNLVVVGYGGADHSIMSELEAVKHVNNFCLLWCGSSPENLHWRVINLLNTTENSYFIEIPDFETLVFKLWNTSNKELPDLKSEGESKQKRLLDFATKFQTVIMAKSSSIISNKEKSDFDDTINEWFKQAYEEKDPNRQVELYSQVIEKNPQFATAYNNRGFAYYNLREMEKAIEDYEKAIAINKQYKLPYNNKGALLHESGKYAEAVQTYSDLIREFPDDAIAYNDRALSYISAKNFNEAINDLNDAIRLNPDFDQSYNNRGYAYYNIGEIQKALRDYDKAIAINKQFKLPYNNKIILLRESGKHDEVIQTYSDLIREFPDDEIALNDRALAYLEAEKYDETIADLKESIRINTGFSLAYNNLGYTYFLLSRFEMALENYDKAILLNKDFKNALNNRANLFLHQKQFAEAAEDYSALIRLDPENGIHYDDRGVANYYAGRIEDARADYLKAVSLMPDNAELYKNLAEFHILTGNYTAAEDLIQHILPKAVTPVDKAIFYYFLCLALIAADKQSDDAERQLGKLLPGINKSVWPTRELVKWSKAAKLTPQKRSKIKNITALIIRKDNPDAII